MKFVFKKPFEVEIREEILREVKPNEVLIKTLCALISTGTKLTAYSSEFPKDSAWSQYIKYPFRPGYCNVGEVIKVGSNVKDIKEGDRAASLAPHQDYVIVPEDQVIKIPSEIFNEEAAFHTIAVGVMNSIRLAKVSLGDKIAIARGWFTRSNGYLV